MAYTINDLTIDHDRIVANVTIALDAKTDLAVTVPVVYPKTKEAVIAAIEAREKAERLKADAAPVLAAIKADLDATVVGKAQTSKVG